MGLIVKPTNLTGDKGSATVQALYDTRASASFLRREIAERIATVSALPSAHRFTLGDGKDVLRVQEAVNLDITIDEVTVSFDEVTVSFNVLVVDELGEGMIIGADMLQRWKIRLDPEQEEGILTPG
jgi:hypothetical protein